MSRLFDAVLFDRDGTLVVDVPYNGDPERVEPVPGAADAVLVLVGLRGHGASLDLPGQRRERRSHGCGGHH